MRVGLPCAPCDDNVVNIPLLLGLLFMSLIFGGIALSGILDVVVDNGIVTDLRILIGSQR